MEMIRFLDSEDRSCDRSVSHGKRDGQTARVVSTARPRDGDGDCPFEVKVHETEAVIRHCERRNAGALKLVQPQRGVASSIVIFGK
jgi:hypothetical protein